MTAQLEPGPLTEAEVEDGLQKGISPTRMKALVSEFGVDFAFDDAVEKRLRGAGADDSLLVAIAKSKK